MEEEGRKEEILVSEVEIDKEGRDSREEGSNNDNDNRFFLNLNISL